MGTAYTQRLTVVCRPAGRAAANQAAQAIDPAGGADALSVGLVDAAAQPSDTVTAWWCSWALTPGEVTGWRQALRDAGFSVKEVAVVTAADKPGFVPPAGWGLLVFQGEVAAGDGGWLPGEVLAALGLDTYVPEAFR